MRITIPTVVILLKPSMTLPGSCTPPAGAQARYAVAYPDGRLRWSVTATAHGQDLHAEADTQTEAWRAVAEMGAELLEDFV